MSAWRLDWGMAKGKDKFWIRDGLGLGFGFKRTTTTSLVGICEGSIAE